MKAQIIQCTITEGAVAMAHGMYYRINRLYIPGAQLTLTPHRSQVYVQDGRPDHGSVLAEVEIDDDLFKLASEFMRIKRKLERRLVENESSLAEYFNRQWHP